MVGNLTGLKINREQPSLLNVVELTLCKGCAYPYSAAARAATVRWSRPGARLLVDAGFSRRDTARRLSSRSANPPEDLVDAIPDQPRTQRSRHVAPDLRPLARKWRSSGLRHRDHARQYLASKAMPAPGVPRFSKPDAASPSATLKMRRLLIPHHDAADPVGFAFFRRRIARRSLHRSRLYAGVGVKRQLHGCRVLVLEIEPRSLEMLMVGPYPYSTSSKRVMSHAARNLSNLTRSWYALRGTGSRRRHARCWCSPHLSENNNHPAIAPHQR